MAAGTGHRPGATSAAMPDIGVLAPSEPVNGLDEAKTAALIEYVRKLAHELLLDNWTIRIEPDRPHKEDGIYPIAQTYVLTSSRYAEIRFMPELFTEPERDERDLRQTLLHELLHLHIEHGFMDVTHMLERSMAPSGWATVEHNVTVAMERMVDGLADAMAPKYDLIIWPAAPAPSATGERTMDDERTPDIDSRSDAPADAPEPTSTPTEPADDSDDDADVDADPDE